MDDSHSATSLSEKTEKRSVVVKVNGFPSHYLSGGASERYKKKAPARTFFEGNIN